MLKKKPSQLNKDQRATQALGITFEPLASQLVTIEVMLLMGGMVI